MGIEKRRKMKVVLNASVDARIVVKLEDIAISRRAKISPIVQEILELGIKYYEIQETKEICDGIRRDQAVLASVRNANPGGQK